ncbi:MAG: hypothetical protein H0W76_14280 [Pyrinomonadaceae bacterium]|nr:hypothetical protein [Pyrinomonadaceae bacterium]
MFQAPRLSVRSIRMLCAGLFLIFLTAAPSNSLNAAAQSGRRAPKSNLPQPPPSPPTSNGTTPEAQGESESISRGATKKTDPSHIPVAALEFDSPFLNVSYYYTDLVMASFIKRLSESATLSVKPGGKTNRKAARDRAKNESETFVVGVEFEEDTMTGRQTVGRTDPSTLILRYYLYAPRTGTLKGQGRMDQRPYSSSTRIGGMRLPLPTPRGRGMIEYVLDQLGRDAADRVMASLNVIPPPER